MSSKNTQSRQSPTLLQDQSSSAPEELSLLSSVDENNALQHPKKVKPIAMLAVSGLLASGITGLFLMQKNTPSVSPAQATLDTKKVSSLPLVPQQQILASPSTPDVVAKQTLQAPIANNDLSNNITASPSSQLKNKQPSTTLSAKTDAIQPAKETRTKAQVGEPTQTSTKPKELVLKNNSSSVKNEQKKRTSIQTTTHHDSLKKQKKSALLAAKAKVPTKRQQAKTSSETQPLLDDTEMRLLRVMLGNEDTKQPKR